MAKTEEQVIELNFEQKLEAQISMLEDRVRKSESSLYQLIGALANSKGLLDEYKLTNK